MTKCQFVCLNFIYEEKNIFCLFKIGSNFLIIRNESKIRPYLANYKTYMYCLPPLPVYTYLSNAINKFKSTCAPIQFKHMQCACKGYLHALI